MNLIQRPRRLRNGSVLRSMVRETRISADTLIYPMFVIEGTNIKKRLQPCRGSIVGALTGWMKSCRN